MGIRNILFKNPNDDYQAMKLRKDLPFKNPNTDYYEEKDRFIQRKIYHCAGQMRKFVQGYVIDLGCGDGKVTDYMTAELNPNNVLCVDFTNKFEKQLRAKGYEFLQMDLDKLPYDLPDEAFDTVISSDVVEHLLSPYGYLSECYRILKPDGCLILSTPDCMREQINIPHINYFSQESIVLYLQRVGFEKKNIKRIYNGIVSPSLTSITSKIPVAREYLNNGCYYVCKK